MAYCFALKHANKHPGVVASKISSLGAISGRSHPQTLHFLPKQPSLPQVTKRYLSASNPLASLPTSSLQSPAGPATAQQTGSSEYLFQHTPRDRRESGARITHILRGPASQASAPAALISKVTQKPEHEPVVRSGKPYWQKIPFWQNTSEEDFIRYAWQMGNTIQKQDHLLKFLAVVLPEIIPYDSAQTEHIRTREDFIKDVEDGMKLAPMSVRLTPHVLSVIDWSNPLPDPVRCQFIPMKSTRISDHAKLELDSLHEADDSPVPGLVHRYPEKALFLATSVCPVYCRFCTRSYSVGQDTPSNTKKSFKPTLKRWEKMFEYIEQTPALTDIVVSGGDSYLLPAQHLTEIGERLLSTPHIRRFRLATKGLAVCPSRILDPNDPWTGALIALSNKGRKMGKAVAVHTHFNHPNEITWVTRMAAQRLFENGVMVRNQSVLLRGVNDSVDVMGKLIRDLADINIIPYYVYQGDMVRGVEDLRTPLQTILDIETQIRGTIGGFLCPQFVVDLPGGGGKRLAASKLSYDRKTGVSTFVAPAVNKKKGGGEETVFMYYDPVWSLEV